MEGIRIVKNGKMEKKEKLPEKTNKYNLEYLMQAKELILFLVWLSYWFFSLVLRVMPFPGVLF